MDHPIPYPSHLAQMSTGQREPENHCLPGQTIHGISQQDTLQLSYGPIPYHQSSSNWVASRVPQSMHHHQDLVPGHHLVNPWGVTIPYLAEQQSTSSLPYRGRNYGPVGGHANGLYSPFQSPTSSLHEGNQPRAVMDHPLLPCPITLKTEPESLMPYEQHPPHSLSTMWMHQEEPPQSFVYHPMDMESAMKMEDSEGTLLSIPTASPSPISTTSTHHSTSHRSISHHSSSQSPTSVLSNSNSNLINTMVENLSPTNSSGDSEEDHPTDPPYSQLIYQALKETTGYRLQLQDIYAWFEKNTNKGKDQGKGWQNSIRHNLSMNAGFEAIRSDSPGGKRTVNYWSLTAQAISKGRVESTTRYRRPNPKRSANSDLPTPRRNGHGVCQRGSVKLQKTWEENQSRQQAKHHHHRHHDKRDEKAKHHDKHRPTTTTTTTTTTNTAVSEASHQQPQHQHSPSSLDDGLISQHSQQQGGGQQSPYHQLSPGAPVPQIYPRAFDYDAVVGCTAASHENSPMFSDSTPGWEPMRMGDYEWCYAPNNGAGDGSGDQSSLYGHGHVKEERWG